MCRSFLTRTDRPWLITTAWSIFAFIVRPQRLGRPAQSASGTNAWSLQPEQTSTANSARGELCRKVGDDGVI